MKRILLIEDNESVRENTAEILELANYDVETAENGKRGVEKAKSARFDLIICDIMMPELDGYGVLHILNKDPKTSAVPFMFLTAKAEKSDFRRGMNMGADDYLVKPFEETDLLQAVELRLKKSERFKSSTSHEEQHGTVQKFMEEAGEQLSLENMINDHHTKLFRKKESIYREGEYPHALYYIKTGKVKLSRSSDYGKEFITSLCSAGEFLGYLALLENTPFQEEAAALEDSEVVLIPIDEFRKLIYSNREVANNFIKILSHNAIEQEERLLKLAYGNVRERVASIVLHLFEKYGNEALRIELAISREELAGYAGIATESLIRTLSEFKSEQLISNDGKIIVIEDLDRLKRVASGGV